VECQGCGWLRQNPRPTVETIGYFYPADYINYIGAVEDEPSRWRQWDRRYGLIKRRRAIERLQPSGRILDVGCATGIFLHEMQQAGWDVAGVEPNQGAAAYAQERFGLPVHLGMLREAALPGESYDVVTLWDVLEHLHTPWADLVEAHRLLKPGGLIALRIPNLESGGRRWFGPAWLGWDLPRHLYFYPRQALAGALSDLGFEVEGFRCIAASYYAWVMSLQFYLADRYSPNARGPQRILRILRSYPARLGLAPVFWAVSQARLSAIITVFARKRSEDLVQA
jgi:SAM-dependent methyltransferase